MTLPSWMRRLATRRNGIRLGLAVLVFAVLWSAGWFVVPALVRSQAEKVAIDKLGRRLTLGSVAFNPWTLELTISDLSLAAANAGAPAQLEVKRIHADAALLSLFRFAPVIDALDIDAPLLRVSRLGHGRYDFDDVLDRLAAAPSAEGGEPARFAVHNIVVRGGAADFIDAPLGSTHRVRELELGVPFVSSLPSQREIKVEPRLAFTLDGSRFDSAATATPFAERGAGVAKLKLDRFDVAPWLGYLPQGLPVRLQTALLSADLVLVFEQRPTLALRLSGTVGVADLKVADAASQELLHAGSIKVAIDNLRPLERIVKLARIDIDAPHVLAVRNAAGRVNLLLAAEQPSGATVAVARVPLPTTAASAAAKSASPPSASSAAASGTAASPPPAPAWKATLAALSIRAGQLDWRDATTVPAAALTFSDFSFDAQSIAWPLDAPVVFKGQGLLGAAKEQGKVAFSGQGNAAGATVKVGLDALPIAVARPYLRGLLVPPLAGALSADLSLQWQPADLVPRLRLDADRIALAGVVLGESKAPEFAAALIEVTDARVDTAAQTAALGRLALSMPRLRVERASDGRWNFDAWQPHAASGRASPAAAIEAVAVPVVARASPTAAASRAPAAPAWRIVLGDFAIDKGRVGFVDRSLAVPAALDVIELGVQAHGWALDTLSSVPFRLKAGVAVPVGPSGKAAGAGVVGSVDARGEMKGFASGVPSAAKATLLLKDLPLHLLDPYLDNYFTIDVQKAQTSFKGDLAWEHRAAGASLAVHGDATVDDLRASSVAADRAAPRPALVLIRDGAPGRQLLNWKSLSLRGIDVALVPGQTTRVTVAETALIDFFARIVLDENGRLNLQDVAQGGAPAVAPAGAASGAAAARAGAVASAASAAGAVAAGPAAIVNFGPIAVVNGRVAYNDRFVKPNYSANVSELTGRLAAFSSQPPAPGEPPLLADLALSGRVEGTASLDIIGKVNPLAKPLALDIKATVRDLELPPLSPYAIKYSGYGIERGKMSVDLAYVVLPNGQLTASNKIVLNQLAFGDKVEGSTASLPVKLAVALLADRHGVIDLDLPVSGSINDPQFSLGGVIWKLIGNLIVKAVTAPFALLASAFGGGGSELSTVEFAPGTATLGPAAREGLDKVAKALLDRPALTLTVSGESRLESERDARKADRLQQLVRSEKRRQAIAAGASPSAEVTVGEGEYAALLKEVYKRADIVKPKNVLGLAKDLPTAEMQALLLASITVGDEAMQQLAVRRGVAVRDYLASKELPASRLFLGAPKVAPGEGAWTPRADLKLTME
ncbi:MAG: DUF748 domain-containing protein [Caldimonas sp.]